MAIVLDATTQGADPSGFSHTIASQSNRVLFVSTLGGSSFADNITGVTFNGVSMTLVGKSATDGDRWNYLFVLFAPATGTHTVEVSKSGSDFGATVATSYYGVQQSIDAYSVQAGVDTSSKTVSLTTIDDNCWLVMAMHIDAGPTAGTGTTFRGDRFWDSNGSVGTAGSHSLQLTWSGTVGWSSIIVSISPDVSTNVTVSATVLTATFSIPAYTVTAIQNVTIAQGDPPIMTMSIPAYTVTAIENATVSPSAQVCTFLIPPYEAYVNDALVSASVATCTFSIPAYTVTAERYVTVDSTVPVATFSIPAYVVEIVVVADVSPVVAIFSTPSPSISGDSNISPSAQVLTFSIPSYTPSATRSVDVSATVLTATFSTPAPTISTVQSPTILPDPIVMTLSIPLYTIVADFWQEKFAQPSTSWSDKY